MPKGAALTIGLNAVDPAHYGGWSGELNACEADANDMTAIAKSAGMTVKSLLTKAGTRARVIKEITSAASSLKSGDIFLLSYSGHGGQLPDLNGDEIDSQDETWCLYDGELLDDEIYTLLAKFAAGVRIVVFSDSCHSGTVLKASFYPPTAPARAADGTATEVKYRNMPIEVALRTYRDNKAFYDPILSDPKLKESRAAVKASAILLSGCQDNQLSQDGTFNGLFTGTMLRVWNAGKFKGGYRAFHKSIVGRMPPDQTSNFFRVGQLNSKFENQSPFKV
ncbi:MAG TPA: caspase family protein [Blastocatellia bacterium]|nr:caspase family protein [Blastocatellia bacterium]